MVEMGGDNGGRLSGGSRGYGGGGAGGTSSRQVSSLIDDNWIDADYTRQN